MGGEWVANPFAGIASDARLSEASQRSARVAIMMSEENKLRIFDEAFLAEENGEISSAIELYLIIANEKYVSAQVNLGNIFDDIGRHEDAAYWYKRAVRQGNRDAAQNLVVHFRDLGQRRRENYWKRRYSDMGTA
ncbi:TPR repeat protein [Sphingomonas leidyi]|uniref:TPR repeat protein n=1 Tax=Sphingomonas leidyi TaxID=68569 RepID=A0A7X5UY53_9SPHN|nr:hypothetical protein [Sphingomonas leidyi]NIJ64341.1 TPR repeat protein [Sphingomonas leidyi]